MRAVVERVFEASRVTSVPVLVFVMTTLFQSTEHFELGDQGEPHGLFLSSWCDMQPIEVSKDGSLQ